ncbi:hypothetical protein QJS04_geneDACA015230 [Acorus gramineus]|uniref:Retrotransposon gag domain-containing protein n=1 Tax=Acorus gramineus TaxID=55184 RepID=A0AAV9BC48_ACOGR|nr:hypothetical protein QJS04_geneDACA015230 [Acorus gramineus]
MFAEHFIYSRRRKKDLGDLMKIQMLSGEMIRQFVDRFRILKFKVEDCNEDAAIMAFRNGLSSGNGLKESLIKHTPYHLRDLMGRAEKYAKVEEESKTLKLAMVASRSPPTVATPSLAIKRPQEPHKKDQRGKKGKRLCASTNEVREGRGMFFKIPLIQILSKIQGEPWFRWPAPMRSDESKRDQALHCDYHRSVGHTIDQRRILRGFLETQFQKGRLEEYGPIEKASASVEWHVTSIDPNTSTGVIDDIFGGVPHHISPKSAHRDSSTMQVSFEMMQIDHEPKLVVKRQRSGDEGSITFSNADLEGVQAPHSDALVITLRISNFDVKRILVVTGIWADILFMKPFLRMGLKAADLTPMKDPSGRIQWSTSHPRWMNHTIGSSRELNLYIAQKVPQHTGTSDMSFLRRHFAPLHCSLWHAVRSALLKDID